MSEIMLPKISLVTPIYNGAQFLEKTLAGIRAQKYPNFEYIVCDGGSTDGTLEILKANRDMISQLIVGKDKGMYDALAKGFSVATGDILGWLGCDDLLMPWCLRCVGEYMRDHPEARWVTGIPCRFDGEDRLTWVQPVTPYYRRSWINRRWYSPIGLGVIQQESTFFSRQLYEMAGGLAKCDWMRNAGDFDLWCRFAGHAELHQLGIMLAGYRLHGNNITGDGSNYYREARAVKIPGGRVLGDAHSLAMQTWFKFKRPLNARSFNAAK
jgi:glycosyltransferase involved in cell wall biosynthesis